MSFSEWYLSSRYRPGSQSSLLRNLISLKAVKDSVRLSNDVR